MSTTTKKGHRQNLTPLLHPESLAIVGISQPGRFGGILAQNISQFGYEGTVYGVNPRYDSIYDRPCYASLRDLPARPDLAALAVPNSGHSVRAKRGLDRIESPGELLGPAPGDTELQHELAHLLLGGLHARLTAPQ